ncbi:MAG: hypothetical protein EOP42_17205 [Sphingobacteriaceae bacterium]|nr:MAG: hypothetical protein EOP42_17205 [Sphingobacteriaceae bacterium]
MSTFNIDIPRKDHTMTVRVEDANKLKLTAYNLFYEDQLFGCLVCNENNVWIYEPHAHEALILNAEEIQALGKQISEHAN